MGEGRRMLGQLPPIAHGCKLAPTATRTLPVRANDGREGLQGGGEEPATPPAAASCQVRSHSSVLWARATTLIASAKSLSPAIDRS
jgi:hypothetical protein